MEPPNPDGKSHYHNGDDLSLGPDPIGAVVVGSRFSRLGLGGGVGLGLATFADTSSGPVHNTGGIEMEHNINDKKYEIVAEGSLLLNDEETPLVNSDDGMSDGDGEGETSIENY